ncbi:MAG: hypothetical protein L3J23_05585 [Flavobacteriaceae bacterium]|nr:hypothetical protein [Flavobacteriaceae bacterium]
MSSILIHHNTGKDKEWIYNDKFIDKNDRYSHSKWLYFMNKRLRLAKLLLKNTGVIFISIDDKASLQPNLTELYENIETAKLLQLGDSIKIFKNKALSKGILTDIKYLNECSETFTITNLDSEDSFFANGILVGTESTIIEIVKK